MYLAQFGKPDLANQAYFDHDDQSSTSKASGALIMNTNHLLTSRNRLSGPSSTPIAIVAILGTPTAFLSIFNSISWIVDSRAFSQMIGNESIINHFSPFSKESSVLLMIVVKLKPWLKEVFPLFVCLFHQFHICQSFILTFYLLVSLQKSLTAHSHHSLEIAMRK